MTRKLTASEAAAQSAQITEMIAQWTALRLHLASECRSADGSPQCGACARTNRLVSISAGIFACENCLEGPIPKEGE